MTEENQKPSPDEEMTAPPVEEDIATLEREARARREAELKGMEEEEDNNPVQPAVNRLKKRKHGRATAFLAIVAVALIGLAWAGNWAYRNILWQPEQEKQPEEAPKTSNTDYRQRTNLGMASDTDEAEPAPQGASRPEPKGAGQTAPSAPPGLDKARFLLRREGTTAAQSQVRTRQQEMAQVTSAAAGQPGSNAATPGGQPQNPPAPTREEGASVVRRIPYNPDLYIPENTGIPCSLDYRFVSDRAGKMRCTVVKDIWSASGNTKLIEKGTTASLVYRTGAEEGMKHGVSRAFIIATKLRTNQRPFIDIPLIDTGAAGELGEAGMDGWIDSHFKERFLGAAMIGIIPDIGAWASDNAGKKDRNTDYTENSRQAMAEMAKTTLENSINIAPTLYKNQGEIINLITGKDIDFSNIYTLKMKR
ncbi:type VI secretion protein [Salmonella enterica]|nr:type VI secretion protein [Salmonella enterica]